MPQFTPISSFSNPIIKRIRALQQRKVRQEQGVFFVEGIQAVWQAVESGAEIETLVVAPSLLASGAAYPLIEGRRRVGTPVVEVTRDLFEAIAERAHASGLAAIVQMRRWTWQDLAVRPSSFFVALHEVQYPGNLGTILRTVDAVGGSGVLLIGETTDPYHPQAVKASMGALFSVPVVRVKQVEMVLTWCERQGVTVVTTSPHATQLYWSASYQTPSLFLFGSEGQGLPDWLLAAGQVVQIPMAGHADSLNLAIAAGVLLYEVKRQQGLVSSEW